MFIAGLCQKVLQTHFAPCASLQIFFSRETTAISRAAMADAGKISKKVYVFHALTLAADNSLTAIQALQ